MWVMVSVLIPMSSTFIITLEEKDINPSVSVQEVLWKHSVKCVLFIQYNADNKMDDENQ